MHSSNSEDLILRINCQHLSILTLLSSYVCALARMSIQTFSLQNQKSESALDRTYTPQNYEHIYMSMNVADLSCVKIQMQH